MPYAKLQPGHFQPLTLGNAVYTNVMVSTQVEPISGKKAIRRHDYPFQDQLMATLLACSGNRVAINCLENLIFNFLRQWKLQHSQQSHLLLWLHRFQTQLQALVLIGRLAPLLQ